MADRPDDRPADPPTMAAQRLRAAIDRGETGDKVPNEDPAAAPLGTDDEAAGTRPPPTVAPSPSPGGPRVPPGQKKGYEIGTATDAHGTAPVKGGRHDGGRTER
ncbi:hypothetical protein [Azospirillum sp. ST 5-10]|uniref:hypothetical protein n=1 Tax=unclassified Azospirillum TaxID=2630922 RepID=UPI003F4A20FC